MTSGIAAELIKAYDSGQSVSLNEVRAKISKKHGYGGVPRLVDIISAIPDDYKKALLPKLRARPIRTASGVCFALTILQFTLPTLSIDCRGRSYVQASPMPAHSYDGQHLRVCGTCCGYKFRRYPGGLNFQILSWWSRLRFRLQYSELHRLRADKYEGYSCSIRPI